MKHRCKIRVGFLFVFLFISLLLTRSAMLMPLLISVAMHELGHVVMARICRITLTEFKLGIFGAALTPYSLSYSYRSEILLALGGPLFNAITVAAFWNMRSSPFFASVVLYSISLAFINMLPIISFDGGRIFSCTLSLFLTPRLTNIILKATSFIMIFILWTISVYLLLRRSTSLTAFIFSLSLFSKIFIGYDTSTN